MRLLARFLIFLLVVLAVVFGIQQYAAESGEVVILTAPDASGDPQETRLWIVDHEGQQWLRAGFAGSGWLQRLTAAQTIALERNGQQAQYRAVVDMEATPAINSAMADKYGWADRYIGAIFGGRDDSVAIKLIPQP